MNNNYNYLFTILYILYNKIINFDNIYIKITIIKN